MKLKLITLFSAASILGAFSVQGQVILTEWNTTGFAGTETSIASSNVASNFSATAITLGSALGSTSGGGGINTNGWDFNELFGANGNYWGFSIELDSGYLLNLSEFLVTVRSSNTGPRDFAVRYSGDSFASNIDTFSTSGSSYIATTLDLSGLGTLSAGTYEFRIVATSSIRSNGDPDFTTGGTHRIMNFGSTSPSNLGDSISLSGEISVIPEPEVYAAIFGLLSIGIALVVRRRRMVAKS